MSTDTTPASIGADALRAVIDEMRSKEARGAEATEHELGEMADRLTQALEAPTTQAAPAAVAGQCEDAIELLGKYKELCEEIKRGDSYHLGRIDSAISVLAQTAPQPAVQQGGPVVWRSWDSENSRWNFTLWPDEWAGHADAWEPLYTQPASPAAQGDALDAERYRLLRRGQRWSVIGGIGDTLRGDELDAAIDAARVARSQTKDGA